MAALALFGLVYTNVYMAAPAPAAADEITVEKIFGERSVFVPLPAHVAWVGDGEGVSYLVDRGEGDDKQSVFVVRDVPSGRARVVCVPDTAAVPDDLRESDDDKFGIGEYEWDRRGKRVVFTYHGDLFTLDRGSGRITRRTATEGDEEDPTFSPDGKRVAYSRDHDLFVLDLESGAEIPLTTTGSDSVLNGVLDWVYMEELFTRGNVRAYWWSPDGARLAFLEIREAPVPEFPLVDWIPLGASYKLQRYPRPGDANPLVRVGIVGADGSDVTWADVDTGDDSYIARVYWLGDSRAVAIEKLNRNQDRLSLLFADARTGETELVFDESSDTWVNVTYLHHYYEKKRQFIWGSERDGHSHLYLFNLDGSPIRRLTSGDWEVTSLDGVDESKGKVYFTANEKSVLESHLYVVGDDGKGMTRISEEEGWHSVTMSPNNKYYIDRFSTHERPTKISVYSAKGKKLFDVGDSVGDEFMALERATPEFFTIDHDGRRYQCMMTKPLDFDPTKKYPVIVYTYGGPGSQVVHKGWSGSSLWHSMMAQKGFIVFSLDNRGAQGYGKAWEDWLLEDMGHYELEDQMAGVEYLKTLPYVDADNIGIWGWSYGGYMTLMALFKEPGVFKAGVSVAPVTDWRSYDSIYTERYMKLPQDNEEGYKNGSPINFVDDFQGDLLLMHGDADDNVHFQNSVRLVQELIQAGKDFDMMLFPQRLHGIRGAAERVFLFKKMTRFFERHLKGVEETPPMNP